MKVVSFHCGTCGREVSVTDYELRNLRTVDCRLCTETRAEVLKSAGDSGDVQQKIGRAKPTNGQ